jgi:putative oxidoreductase
MSFLYKLETYVERLMPQSLASLLLRVALGLPFFKSGLTKWEGFGKLSESATLLFTEEFKLHILGREYPFPYPEYAAWGAGIGEILLPILVFLGLFTRFAAFGLLIMTVIIQLTIPDAWANFHLPWAALAAALMVVGGGKVSLDWMLRKTL